MIEYALLDGDGKIQRVVRTVEPLSPEQMRAESLMLLVREHERAYNPSTHKEDGFETIVSADDIVIVRPRIVAKSEADKREEALQRRANALPHTAESLETVLRVLAEVIRWIDAQVVPGDLKTRFQLAQADRSAIQSMLGAIDAHPVELPDQAQKPQ